VEEVKQTDRRQGNWLQCDFAFTSEGIAKSTPDKYLPFSKLPNLLPSLLTLSLRMGVRYHFANRGHTGKNNAMHD